jgi:RND family efflux transporter MFP subunit
MKSRRNRIIIGIVCLLVVGAIIGFIYYRANATATVTTTAQTATVTRGTISTSIAAGGTIRARQTATLSWQAVGIVGAIEVKVGDVVTAGQELATLSNSAIPQTVVSAQASLLADQQSLNDLLDSKTVQATALKALEDAQTALDNYKNNFPSTQGAAKADLVTAQANLTLAQNQLTSLTSGKVSQGDIDVAQSSYYVAKQALNKAQSAFDKVSDLSTSDSKYKSARADLADAKANFTAAEATLDWYLGKPSESDIATAESTVATYQADLATAQNAWDLVKNGPDSTQIALLEAAVTDAQRAYDLVKTTGANPNDVAAARAKVAGDQSTINSMKITAPFSGTITSVSGMLNDQTASGTSAFTMADLSHMLVDVTVSEYDIPNIQVDQAANITFDALSGKAYTGKVVDVSQVGATSSGVVNFTVTVEMTDADKNILPGMTAAVSIITESKQNVLYVPSKAVHTVSGQKTVTVLSEGKETILPVTIGLVSDSYSEIASGDLKEGDAVVVGTTSATTSSSTSSRGGIFGSLMGRLR